MRKRRNWIIKRIIIIIITALMFPGVPIEPAEPEYIVIERDYEGTILLDAETGKRYLRTDEEGK